MSNALELQAASGRSLSIRVRTELTKSLMQQLGPDGEFWDARQCVLDRNADNQWVLSPLEETTNETLLNGKAINQASSTSAWRFHCRWATGKGRCQNASLRSRALRMTSTDPDGSNLTEQPNGQ